jgi:FAD/FMN-containing dehydrogenase
VAGAGAPLQQIHDAAAARGLFFPPDPTEWSASIGGVIATNASGSRSFRYGPARRWIESLEVVMASGEVRRFCRGEAVDFDVPAVGGPQTRKNTAGLELWPGMDWIDLFTGSEGTLGVVTEASLRLLPKPAFLITGVVFFPDDDFVISAVDSWRGIDGLRMLEYFDRGALRLLRSGFEGIPSAAGGALLFEHELPREEEAEIDAWLDRLEEAGADLEGSWFASSDRDRERFRRFRHSLPEQVNDAVRKNGFLKLGSDYAAPVEHSGQMLRIYRERLEAGFPGKYVIFGHIGDAHVHVNILPESAGEFDRGAELMLQLAREVVSLGGTVSAEHGLGKRKAQLLGIQFSGEQIEQMRQVKRRLDPAWILGRGNLFAGP